MYNSNCLCEPVRLQDLLLKNTWQETRFSLHPNMEDKMDSSPNPAVQSALIGLSTPSLTSTISPCSISNLSPSVSSCSFTLPPAFLLMLHPSCRLHPPCMHPFSAWQAEVMAAVACLRL
ncbi:hypothetical protein AMECASPLE_023998 [Ameca splendens]|uniref:Uncharacterized protein n=1 Tax=Ameca splendens TaxID=208324 RepID=A0ABV1AD63_9TELE